ncbi:SMP-30/gluconolactonase/LRE family protein [Patulibacter americanus]|uniref:SMP-30/gluconolactonase/LRE family protein n=1 Tax=Patulibacter americanus TaxID=588672 RepID=UPI0003B7A6F2|nr:SMP-30/gluconolactonase/LRE family protein [Patulibacter americanus]
MAGSRTLATLQDGGAFFECPRWHDGRWWAVDFYRHGVFSYDADGTETLELEVPAQPSGLGWLPDGDLLVVSMRDRRVLRRGADGAVRTHAELGALVTGHLNDMVVDRAGRAYVGNFGFDLMGGADPAPTNIVRVDPDGTATVAAEGLSFPNGTVITDDGTLIVAETLAGRLTAFTVGADGALTDRRAFADIGPTPEGAVGAVLGGLTFAPDGIALDAEGHVWAADAVGRRACRVAAGGEVVDEVVMPDGLGVYACGLGGEDGRTLVCCAAPDFYEQARSAAREGVLLTTTVDVPHAGTP